MADSELESLKKEVGFTTPLRQEVQDDVKPTASPYDNFAKISQGNYEKAQKMEQDDKSAIQDDEDNDDESYVDMTSSFKNELDETLDQSGTSTKVKKARTKEYKYRLFHVDDPNKYCGRVMGQSSTFCINIECTTGHIKDDGNINLVQGQCYVLKTKEQGRAKAFNSPMIDSTKVEPEVVSQWLKTNNTLQGWSRVFRAAKNTFSDESLSSKADIMAEKQAIKQTRSYKTPKKEAIDKTIRDSPVMKYESISLDTEQTSDEQAEDYVRHIDATFKAIISEIEKVKQNQKNISELLNNGSQNYELRLTELSDEVGSKPHNLSPDLDTPSLWATIGEIGCKFDNFKGNTINVGQSDVDGKLNKLREEMKQTIVQSISPVEHKSLEVRQTLLTVVRSLKQQLIHTNASIQAIKNTQVDAHSASDLSLELKDLNERMLELESNTARLANKDGDAIKFHNLGFRDKSESDAWLEMHAPEGHFGLIVDFHTLMEHIHHSITGVDAMKQLQSVYKLKLATISEALAVTSFEVNMPRFLSKTGAHLVIDNDTSYFNHIPTYKFWHDPNSGYKQRLKKELERFRRAHMSTIRDRISVKSPLFAMAMSSLTESIAWTNGLINYIDITYDEYAAGKFGTHKSWHVTTKLATAIILEVSKPREGSLNSFEAGDGVAMAKVIFYAALQSLDAMAQIASLDYRDSPVVSTELVKFLSLNTSVEAVDKLQRQSHDVDASIKELTKDVAGAKKSIGSVGNKADEMKKLIDALKKRVEKLEAKK